MVDLEQYRENAQSHGICREYERLWESAKSKKQIFDMALGVKAVDYICDSIAKGWGLSPEYIAKTFAPFINGKCVSNQKGYDSKLYCMYNGEVNADVSLICLINCNAKLTMPKWAVCQIYCVGDCKIDLAGDGTPIFICYGEESAIQIQGEASYKRINKKERDSYA